MLPTLKSARLILRPIRMEDAEDLETLINDFEIAKNLRTVPHPYPQGEAAEFIADVLANPGSQDQSLFVITQRDDEKLMGCVALTKEENGDTGIGYWLGKPFWGKGFMTEAVETTLRYAFDDLKRKKIISGMFTDNIASWRVQEKLGFEKIGMSLMPSLARGGEFPHFDTEVTRLNFKKATL